MSEQRYQAILAAIADGRTVAEMAAQWNVDRRTVHRWLARYEGEGLEGLAERSHRPVSCPHQMGADPNGNGRHARFYADRLVENLGGAAFSWGRDDVTREGDARGRYLSGLRNTKRRGPPRAGGSRGG